MSKPSKKELRALIDAAIKKALASQAAETMRQATTPPAPQADIIEQAHQAEPVTDRWQPIMLLIDRRLECGRCQALATIVTGSVPDAADGQDHDSLQDVQVWCQSCYEADRA